MSATQQSTPLDARGAAYLGPDPAPGARPGEEILEIRRLSGLSWEELCGLFAVSRAAFACWVGSESLPADLRGTVRRVLAAVRHLDEGNAAATRDRLSTPSAAGAAPFDLLREGRYDEAMALRRGAASPRRRREPLSPEARNARRPPPPASLLQAEQPALRPAFGARAARPVRAGAHGVCSPAA